MHTQLPCGAAPIKVQVNRGGHVESKHRVHAVVATYDDLIASWGEAERLTMPRSAIKSIQALPLLAFGAGEAFEVTDDELALACSSHGAEDLHVELVSAWLDRIGHDVDALECGPSDPITTSAAHSVYASGEVPTAIHNCCSGKHTGFLTICRHMAADTTFGLPGYLAPAHGVQKLVTAAQIALTGIDVSAQTPVIDGCGIPVFRFPLAALAQAMARLVSPDRVSQELRAAAVQVTSVLPSRALLVSGTGRAEHVLTDAAVEPVILKGGAEGVFMGALPERRIGIALKCDDGSTRGAEEALAAILYALEVTEELVSPNTPQLNKAGTVVGDLTVTLPAS